MNVAFIDQIIDLIKYDEQQVDAINCLVNTLNNDMSQTIR